MMNECLQQNLCVISRALKNVSFSRPIFFLVHHKNLALEKKRDENTT
jgi:hypothetical protein